MHQRNEFQGPLERVSSRRHNCPSSQLRLFLALTDFSAYRFHDHQMITSRKDAIGTELLSIPFPRAELEAILEDLMSDEP
jgi:hypothetical protein